MDELVILITPDGDVQCLYNEEIELEDLGVLSTSRASNVEFDNLSQKWKVVLTDGTYVGSWKSRSKAIEQEIAYLQRRMKDRK